MTDSEPKVTEQQCDGDGCTKMIKCTPGYRAMCTACFNARYGVADQASAKRAQQQERATAKKTRRDPNANPKAEGATRRLMPEQSRKRDAT